MFIMAEQNIKMLSLSTDQLASMYNISVADVDNIKNNFFNKMHDKNMTLIVNNLHKDTIPSSVIIPNLEHFGFTDLLILKENPFYQKLKFFEFDQLTGAVDGYATFNQISTLIIDFLKKSILKNNLSNSLV
jgi:hypothetical protein